MKANEAPEKIYLHPDIGNREFIKPWLTKRVNQESVEYIRKDAFIEKAVQWLKEQKEMVGISFQEDFIERFKNYMKGE